MQEDINVDTGSINIGEEELEVPDIDQKQIISCICSVIEELEVKDQKVLFDWLGWAQELAQEEMEELTSTITGLSRFLKENLQTKKLLEQQIENLNEEVIDPLKEAHEQFNERTGLECSPIQNMVGLLENLKSLLRLKSLKIDQMIAGKIDTLLQPLKSQLDQITNLIQLLDGFKNCENAPSTFSQLNKKAKNLQKDLGNTEAYKDSVKESLESPDISVI